MSDGRLIMSYKHKVAGSIPATVTTAHNPLPRLFPFPASTFLKRFLPPHQLTYP